ncbi:type III secretion system effector avirulence protein AvrBs3 [Xanthomonas translucens]|uniref:type III secretion system effector avirulence protein AvrBs3 n=1 Tax=Xanthomonas campestris pv. translucens TaxID=343 RepID=UPI002009E6AC|nr:type III secretion system effector avirulence protein AvrBs3 [Xanthomonas translucens]UPU50470.1 TAL effector repeat-containing protein [Xanthomonas translucens pv. undulosa]
MDPIRSRTPSPARELQAGSQPDAVQPIADRLVSPPAGSPLDGLPARRTMSRTQLPSPPASVPAFSAGSFSDLLRQVDSSLFDASFFDSMPAFGAHHAQAATGELDEVQSALRAADDPQPPVRVAVTAARPPRAKPAQRPRRAAQTSDASPAADVDLSTFGYSQQQQEKIKPTVRSTVAQHHAALVGHGFTHAHIVELSKHPAALGTIAARYSEMIAALPEATHEDIVGVGKQWSGARALEALLMVAEELRAPPLQLVTGQLLKIAKRGGVTAVEAVHASRNALTGAPLHLTPDQVVAIVSNNGGKQALETVQRLLPVLCQPPYGLTPEQVVAIASHDGAKPALETVQRLLPVLCQPPYGLTPEQVVAIASNGGGKQALETVQRLLPVLCQPPYGLTPGQVVAIASNIGGKQALETVQRLLPVLCQDHGLTPGQVVAIADNIGGKQALETVQRLLPVLCQPPYGLTPEQVVAIACNGGGKQALETVQRLLPVLCKPPYNLTPNQVVAIASHNGGKQALETVQRLLPVLCQPPYGLTPNQVVAIASHDGGKQALETVQRLLPVLCKPPYGLTPDQVVAIASHDGAKQALETVQRLLPVLCQPSYGLTPEQVVAIASHNGGKQALETVQRLLPVLRKPPYGLTPEQVVAIASHDGGKPALETVQRLLPVLCQPPYGLTPNQVVAIASQDGGKQALESIFAQLSSPDPALAALTNDRLVALACIGGRPALDAVKKGLPHAPALITRVHNRVPEGTAHLVADLAQVVRVLSFFQCHSHPAQAFDEAMRQFGMSRHGLLQLFHRVGVTELEARSGTLPPASQRWDRMLQASGRKAAKPPSASAQTQGQESLDAFADSLERELDAPSPMHQAGQTLASSRKRSRSESSVNRSSAQQAAEVFVPEQRDAPPLLPFSSWGVKRRRTRIGGLPDPGTPTHGDLAASSAAFLEQDADPFAGAAEDFPAFDQEEIAWLKELLAH